MGSIKWPTHRTGSLPLVETLPDSIMAVPISTLPGVLMSTILTVPMSTLLTAPTSSTHS